MKYLLAFLLVFMVGCGNEKLSSNSINQSNHMERIRLNKSDITRIKLDAQWDQEWALKSCDEYELVAIQNNNENRGGGRYSMGYSVKFVEVYINVKKPFALQLKYKDNKGIDSFFYCKFDFKE